MLLRWCRGRELGIGRFTRSLNALKVADSNLSGVQEEVYSRNSSAVAFHAVARAMAFGSDNMVEFEQVLDQLGPARVRKAALAAGLIAAVPESNTTQVFDYSFFQRRCLFVAYVLESLAQRLDEELAPDAFVVGLLMDGSYLLMLEHFESDFELSLFSRINNPGLSASQAEEMYMGITNPQVSMVIAEDSKLRPCSIEALLNYRSPSEYGGRFERSVDVCHLAAVIADYSGYCIASGLAPANLDFVSFKRLELKKEIVGHITETVSFAKEVSTQSVNLAMEAVRNVRRFSAA